MVEFENGDGGSVNINFEVADVKGNGTRRAGESSANDKNRE